MDIIPSEKLKWQPCFDIYGPNLQCARLTVPMDYSRPLNKSGDNPKVHLALVMATGAERTQDPTTYAEAPLLINPGGPGVRGSRSFRRWLKTFIASLVINMTLLASIRVAWTLLPREPIWFGNKANIGCNGWEIESKEPPMRWDDYPTHTPAIMETSFPILFLSNSLDPVTPLSYALEMSQKFANASVVEQVTIGHSTISCFSSCTIQHVRAYLNEGVVPPPPSDSQWPRCECAERPWAPTAFVAKDSMVTTVRAHAELRAQFAASTFAQSIDYSNPLRTYLLERAGAGYAQ